MIILNRWTYLLLLFLCFTACQNEQSSLQSAVPDDPLFIQLDPQETGVDFINKVEDTQNFNVFTYRNYYNGGGVAIGDVNNDGLSDLYFTANMAPNKLYLNKGDWKFEEVAEKAGVGGQKAWSTGVAMADVNADGWLDIYICNSGDVAGDNKENELFINQGDGTFVEQAAAYGLNDPGFSTHASFFDYDQDGDLDCYILNNSFKDPRRMRLDKADRNQIDLEGGDKLFRNDGLPSSQGGTEGGFTNVTAEAGIYGSSEGFGLGVSVSDINGDRLPDIYISNDFWERDYLYMNQGNGTFKEELTQRLGLCPSSSMGADVADLNNDGYPEIFTTDMLPGDNFRIKTMTMFDPFLFDQLNFRETYYYQMMQNCLQVNEGNGHFQERAHLSGVAATDWSWGALIFDFDNDGRRDILVSNGIYHNITDMDFTDFVSDQDNIRKIVAEKGQFDPRDLIANLASTPLPNYAFKNKGDLHFENQAFELGLGSPSFSNGAAYGDLDNDGDYDLVVNNENMPAFIYRNDSDRKNAAHFLKIRFEGEGRNPMGVGASVRIRYGEEEQTAQHYLSRSFESSVEPGLIFGLGENKQIDQLLVVWPDGRAQTLNGIAVDQTIILKQSEAKDSKNTAPDTFSPLFAEVTKDVLQGNFRHQENNYNDFNSEPLLWRMLSTEGPRLVSGDVNQDGLDDFVLLGAADQPDRLFLQNTLGRFEENTPANLTDDRDLESVCGSLFDADNDGDLDLLIGAGGNEQQKGRNNFILRLYENLGAGRFRKAPDKTPRAIANFSCISPGDFDGDGDLDLFLGARAIPGNYGLIPRSFLMMNQGNGLWMDVTTEAIGTLGMVTDAAWADIDLDGDSDLIVVGDWMAITIFKTENGQIQPPETIPDSEGWWTRLNVADLDADGRKDIIAGNWGQNSKFSTNTEHPLELWTKDFDGNRKSEFVLQWRPSLENKNVPFAGKKDLTRQMPHLLKRVLSYKEYAAQTYETLLTETEREGAVALQAKQLSSGVFWNRPNGFSWQPLPDEAQVSPAMALCAEDLDGDGKRDIWLGGNFYALKPQVGHLSANHGVFLKGNGQGDFDFIPPRQIGIYIEGEVRDVQWIAGPNGKYTLLISRNNEEMAAFQ